MRSAAAAHPDHSAWKPAGPARAPLPEPRAAAEPPVDPQFVVWQFPALPLHVRMARIWLEAWIADRGPGPDAAYRAAVAFSELVTNAVLHGAGPVTVRALVEPRRIECEVIDGACGLPVVVYGAEEDDEHHRGLSLVEALATSWQVRRRPEGGKSVAFVVEE